MEMLLEQFKILFDRPEKVKKLRELILQLAVRGKLVPQDEKDEPAAVLLERIKEEKERLIREGKIKREKPLPEIREDEKPYELPKGWEWVRLGEVGYNLGQKKPDKKFTYIDVGSINKEMGILGDDISIIEPEDAPSRARKVVDLGTIIYSTVRPYLLNIAIINRNFEFEPIVSTAFAVIHPYKSVHNKFIYYYLRSKTFVKYVENQMVGMAYPAISDEKFFKGLMPLPPINEQHRIVEKVDYLMALCDKLEKNLEGKVKYSSLSSKSVFNSIGNCRSAQELEENLMFIIENFKDLSLSDGAVNELKNAILQLAMQGKLCPQDPSDEPASVLLERIKEEKERLTSEGKLKREKPLPEIREDEKPYELPKGWVWTRLGHIIMKIIGGGTPSKNNPDFWNGNIPWASVKDLKSERYLDSTEDFITEVGLKNSSSNLIPKDNIIICTRMGLGKININRIDVAINQDLKGVFLSNFINPNYFFWLYKTIGIKGKGTTVMGIRIEELLSYVIPLPPLPEQHRIVEKVDSLMSLCDELEKRIQKSKEYSEKLMEALIKEAAY